MEERTGTAPAFLVRGLWLLLLIGTPVFLAAFCFARPGEEGLKAGKTCLEFGIYLLWCGCAVHLFRLSARRVRSLCLGLFMAAAFSLGLSVLVFLYNNLLHFLEADPAGGNAPPFLRLLLEDLAYEGGAGRLRYVLPFTTTLMLCVIFLALSLRREEAADWLEERLRSSGLFADCFEDDEDDDDDNDGLPW